MKDKINKIMLFLFGSLAAANCFAYKIGEGGTTTGGFKLLENFFQSYIDFLTGPFSHAAIAGTLIVGIILWAIMPKEGLMGTVFRVVIAAIVCLNVTTWMGMFTTG